MKENLLRPQFLQYDALLINVPMSWASNTPLDDVVPPFGLGRIAAVANDYFDLNVSILDCQKLPNTAKEAMLDVAKQQLLEVKKRANPGFIAGLNPTHVNLEASVVLADLLTELGMLYVLGGYFASLSDSDTIANIFPQAYGYIRRHGEIAFSLLVANRTKKNQPTGAIAGLHIIGGDSEPEKKFGTKIPPKELPPIDQLKYYLYPFQKKTINGQMHTVASLYETDGCPYNCGFCASCQLNDRLYSRPSNEQIIDDIENLIEQGATAIHFQDDLLFTNEKQVKNFYDTLKERDLIGKFIWLGLTRVDFIDHWSSKTMELLQDTGCVRLGMGIESGSDRIGKMINKPLDWDTVTRVTRKNAKFNIATKAYFIIGYPTETEGEMKQTYDLAIEMAMAGAKEIAVFQYHPYPGTDLYEMIKQNNPEILEKLNYHPAPNRDLDDSDLFGARGTSMWLPDDLCIATVDGSRVRYLIEQTINDFNRIVEEH
jgi:radical SAM superfamily enzyme